MGSLELALVVTPKHSIDLVNISNGTIFSTTQFDVGNMAREPLMIDSEHCILPKGDKYLAIINIKTGQMKTQWSCPEQLKSIHLTYNRAYFFGGAISGKIYIWHFTTGELIRIIDAHYKGVSHMATNEDDSILFSTGLDGTVHVWNVSSLLDYKEAASVSSGSRLKPLVEFSRHSMPITGLVAPPGVVNTGRLYTSSLDRNVIEYCVSSKTIKQIWTLPAQTNCLKLNPTQTQLFVGCTNNEIYMIPLYDTTNYNNNNINNNNNNINNNQSFVSNTFTQNINTQYNSSDKIQFDRDNSSLSNIYNPGHVFPSFIGHSNHITSLSISLHSTTLVSTSLDGTIIIWSIPTRQIIRQVNIHHGKSYPISTGAIIVDTPGAMKINDSMLTQKQFPPLLRDLRPPLDIRNDENGIRFGTNCFTSVPIMPQFDPKLTVQNSFNDPLYEDHLLALIDAENAAAAIQNNDIDVSTLAQLSKKRQLKDDNDEENQIKTVKAELGLKDDKIKELESELQKWKQTAAKLYKQVGK